MGKMEADHKTTIHVDDGTEVKPFPWNAHGDDLGGPNMIRPLSQYGTIGCSGLWFLRVVFIWGQELGYGVTGRCG
ncbi:MAG: hypothetical protein OXC92_02215 [Flavobacteriaceae bacterium]|nr:hypothetical protein [Flavobacteriaceae bacterium]